MPDLVLHLDNGYDYHMSANVYVSTVGHDNKCILMLEENILIDQNFYTLGWHALTRKCWRFDYSADTLSFADVKL
ncbi:hypothetical protein AAVH_42555 [Aphelenchoides avenae]|nr:hypothetical protein AAVH_42555 [Aphelenchus avenae]